MNDSSYSTGSVANNPHNPAADMRRHFWFVAAAYLGFNLLLVPFENWRDIYFGWRFHDSAMQLLPFSQGSFFVLAVVLNSDAIFRAVQHQAIIGRFSMPLMSALLTNVFLLLWTFGDYAGLEDHAAKNPAFALPVVEQLVYAAVALAIGYYVHYVITRSDFGI